MPVVSPPQPDIALAALDKSAERIQRMFSAIAPVYDLLNHLLSLNIDRSWRRTTVRLVPPRGTQPILDLCTGTGDLALEYTRAAGDQTPIIAADFCAPMLVRATRKTNRRQASRIGYVQADAMRLPLPSNCFQIVSVAFGLRNVENTDRGLSEMIRVTQPGGRVAILEFSRPRGTLLSRFYLWYFKYVLPKLGQVISKSGDQAYRYLPASVLAFPDGEAMLARLRQHGLQQVWQRPLTFGIATLYVGMKP